MSTPGPDDPTAPSQPPFELGGLDPKDLLNAGLETVPPVTLPPQLVDSDATIAVSRPQSTQPRNDAPELPLPEELTNLLPHGNYAVESFLGQGGMGAVYKGLQVRLKRPVAIKIMRRDLGKDHDFEARFEREAQAMAKLNHPNIVSVIDYGEAGPDYLYIVMELVDGADLMDVIRGGQMTQEMALSLLPQICDALQFAHDHGIVHRDIKPSNIMLTRDGRIKMADFGLAKRFDAESSFRTQTGTGMGTPDYAAPEQFSPDSPIDHRADIYALGVMIYQMITGHLPRGVWKPPSQRAKVSTQWDAVVSRAMQSDPCDRYQQASEVKTDVSSITPGNAGRAAGPSAAATGPTTANPPSAALGGPSAPPRSRATLLIGLITGVVVIALGSFFALRGTGDGRAAGPPAAASGSALSNPQKAPATPSAALAGASALPASAPPAPTPAVGNTPLLAPPLPESGWKPLFTETEWQVPYKTTKKQVDGSTAPAGRSFENGLLHVQNNAFLKPQPSPDAAIRAQIVIEAGSDTIAVVARVSKADGFYKWGTTTNDRMLALIHFNSGTKTSTMLGKHQLSAPLRPGDKLELELRVQGNRLTALANGAVVIDTQDDRLKAAGEYGLDAHNAWFESVEVQPLPAAAALPESGWKPLFTDAEWKAKPGFKNGLLNLAHASATKPQTWSNGAIRARIEYRDGSTSPCLVARQTQTTGYYYRFGLGSPGDHIYLAHLHSNGEDRDMLSRHFLPAALKPGDKALLELRVQGDRLIGLLDGKVVVEARDTRLQAPGEWGIIATEGWFESVEVQPLPAAATPSPIAVLALSESGWKPLVSKEEWETDWEGSPVNYGGKLVLPNRRFNKGGLLHMQSSSLYKPCPSPDGAIRVESVIRQLPHVINLGIRSRPGDQGRYAFGIAGSGNSLLMRYITVDGSEWRTLQSCPLPAPLKLGDRLKLELRIQGSQITGLWNGVAVLQAQDQRLTAAGEWGLDVVDASIKSVEVQPLPAMAEVWQNALADTAQLSLSGGAQVTKDGLLLTGKSSQAWVYAGQHRGDGAIRMRANADGLRQGLRVRSHEKGNHYNLDLPNQTTLKLQRWDNLAKQSTVLREFPLPPGFNLNVEHELELRAEGSTLTVSLDRQTLGSATDAAYPTGSFGVSVGDPITKPVLIKTLEVLDSGNVAVFKSSDPKFPPGQWVKLFTKFEDLPADLRKPDSGVKFEDGWLRVTGTDHRLPIKMPAELGGNCAVRICVVRGKNREGYRSIALRYIAPKDFYGLNSYDDVLLCSWGHNDKYVTVFKTPIPLPPQAGQEYTMEFAAIGSRLIGRFNDSLVQVANDKTLPTGTAFISGNEDLRDIEVINLDGLPEAEALRLLGVDEQGNDLRGKTGVAK